MIRLDSLRKTYNKASKNAVTAVNGISLELPKTGMVALFGRSGCGKTTLLNLIGGLDKADSGAVYIGDSVISPYETDARNRNIGFIFQNYYLADSLTVEENVAASLRLCGLTDEAEIDRRVKIALGAVGLDKYRRRLPQNLSGGQQQRVAIARAIVKNPEIILADEPTGNLDEANTVMVMDLLREISKNTLVILVTHEAHLVDYYCDRVIEMLDGRIIGERTNETTEGYKAQGKNEVYLGDMQKSEGASEDLSFAVYSNGGEEKLAISIISSGGVFYIRNDTPGAKIRILDSSSELTVHEGSYEESIKRRSEQTVERLSDVVSLPRIREGKSGRMYKLKNGVMSALRRHFAKKMRLRKALIATMFLLSIVFVFISASCMTLLSLIDDVKANYSDNLIYVYKSDIDEQKLSQIKSESKIVFPSMPFMRSMTGVYVSFPGGYSSTTGYYHDYRRGMYASTIFLPEEFAKEHTLICGRDKTDGHGEVIISSAVADAILDSSKLSFIKKYEDLIGLKFENSDYMTSLREMTIVGVVKNSQRESYVDELLFASTICEDTSVAAHSIISPDTDAPERGSVYIASSYEKAYPIGSKISVNGMSYTVGGYFNNGLYEGGDKYYGDGYYKEDVYVEYERTSTANVIITPGYDSGRIYYVIMNDADFIECAPLTGSSTFGTYDSYSSKTSYAIYPKDKSEMKSTLLSLGISGENIHDEEYMYDMFYQSLDVREQIIANLITFAVVSAFIALCMFFIMRSSITSDVKEIGIYRAIGVSRKNIIFKYFVESNVIFFLTVFIGYVATSGLIMAAGSGSSITQSFIYLPWYVTVALGIFLYAISTVCGTLPVTLLTKKPPAAIIAKYDI